MISLMLTILKIIGIILLCILGFLILLILAVLFVPVRYQITAKYKPEEELLKLRVKVTWLLHLLNFRFLYPEAAYLRVRIFCFTLFDSRREPKAEEPSEKMPVKEKAVKEKKVQSETGREELLQEETDSLTKSEAIKTEESYSDKKHQTNHSTKKKKIPPFIRILKKIWYAVKNIKYTIKQICDKIENIVNNVNYYVEIIKSDTFKDVWKKCFQEALTLVKSIRPRKIKGQFIIGTGDPASTAQIFGLYGLLYPVIGNQITMIPDMENSILEGDIYIKGQITMFRLVKAGITIYFNKNLRKVIKMFKREAV